MYRSLLYFIFLNTIPLLQSNDAEKMKPVAGEFPLNWKSEIGIASFRENIILDKGDLFIGSNGNSFMDANLYDKKSGVYKLNRSNGKIIGHFGAEKLGDMDVSGLLLYNDRLYFGNDNEEFICSSKEGKMIWRNPASGDIEHEPVLLNSGKNAMIVYATESGEVVAVDPMDGSKYWSYYTPDFWGWMPGDNRAIFKVKAYFSNSSSFFIKPLVLDLNHDGWQDLVYVTFNDILLAINGYNGKELWSHKDKNLYFGYSLVNVGTSQKPMIQLYGNEMQQDGSYLNKVILYDEKGIRKFDCKAPGYTYACSLNTLRTRDSKTVSLFEDSVLLSDANGFRQVFSREIKFDGEDYKGVKKQMSRTQRNPLLGSRIFSYKGQQNCILILDQYDYGNLENGFISILSLDSKKILGYWALPSRAEMGPLIEDVNQDGKLDLLVSCNDGFLYCYNLGISAN